MRNKSCTSLQTFILATVLTAFLPGTTEAQMPSDAFLMKAGALCIDVSYEHSRFDEYWEGTLKRDNGNMGTLRRHTVSPMFNLGVMNWLNVMGAVKYVVTSPSAGQVEGAKGFSDMSFWVKGEPWRKHLGKGTFNILVTAGIMFPVSDYVPDYPYSIGFGCTEGSFKGIVQYRFDNGFFLRAHAGYMIRGNATLQRTYYYTTEGYFTDECDMPNAMDFSGVLGYYLPNKQIRGELIFDGMHTFGGFDIRRQDMPFPSNQMNFTRLMGAVHYYPSLLKGLDIHAGGGYVLTGRNVGQAGNIIVGISYVFRAWNAEKKDKKDESESKEEKPIYERPME